MSTTGNDVDAVTPLQSNGGVDPNASPNRSAIITGAARGIGRAIAIQLAEDGFNIALNDLACREELNEVAKVIEGKGRKTIVIAGDVSNEDFVQEMVQRTVAELGDLYVMVANAGIALLGKAKSPIVDLALGDWKRIMNTNLDGVFLCYRAAARQMLKQGRGGRIIGASSVYGKKGHPLAGPYSVSKFGVRGLTQVLAGELATSGITVNAYAPGYIQTPMLMSMDCDTEEQKLMKQIAVEKCIKVTPMHKLGTPGDIAGLVSYLASDKAGFITGQSVSINGGLFYD